MRLIVEKLLCAMYSRDLAWHPEPEYEKAIDRITALGMADAHGGALGSALVRAKYLHDRSAYTRALYLLVNKCRKRIMLSKSTSYVTMMTRGVMREWIMDACDLCNGACVITQANGVQEQCPRCEGSGLKRYTDAERERNCGLPNGVWSRAHEDVYDQIMVALTGAAATTIAGIKKNLEKK